MFEKNAAQAITAVLGECFICKGLIVVKKLTKGDKQRIIDRIQQALTILVVGTGFDDEDTQEIREALQSALGLVLDCEVSTGE